jgi:hypothetical protein
MLGIVVAIELVIACLGLGLTVAVDRVARDGDEACDDEDELPLDQLLVYLEE